MFYCWFVISANFSFSFAIFQHCEMEMLLRRIKGLLIQLNVFHEPQILGAYFKLHFG